MRSPQREHRVCRALAAHANSPLRAVALARTAMLLGLALAAADARAARAPGLAGSADAPQVLRSAKAAVALDNGAVGDGHLNVTSDDFGSWADAFGGGPAWNDLFDPSADPVEGSLTEMFPSFTNNLFIFKGPSERAALSSHVGVLGTYAGNLTVTLQTPNTPSGPNQVSSSFLVRGSGGALRLLFDLTQKVAAAPDGPNGETAAQIERTYVITNQSQQASFSLLLHIDEDMPWGGGATFYLDDIVGVDFAELGRPQVYAHDRELTTAALVLRTREDMTSNPFTDNVFYYGGKQGIQPPGNPNFPGGACPAQDFGTDVEIWNNYGLPNCWKNFIPHVGYNQPGQSQTSFSGDAFIGLQVNVTLPASATYEITFVTIYGFRPLPTTTLPPGPAILDSRYNSQNNCGEFLWSLANNNPQVNGVIQPINTFYLDVEAGTGAHTCTQVGAPPGWSMTECTGFDLNGHALVRFSGGTILGGDSVTGRLMIDTNGQDPATNRDTHITVPPLSVVLHAAQSQDGEVCAPHNFSFGPTAGGNWSLPVVATAFVPVPSLATWAKITLLGLVATGGVLLLLRRERAQAS